MANVTKRRTGEFLRKIFDYLWNKPEGLPAREALECIPQSINLTEYETGSYASSPGEQRYVKIIRFATVDLVKAGWLVKNKGNWILTELGKDAYKKYPDPYTFYNEAVRLYHIWKKTRAKPAGEEVIEEEVTVQNAQTLEEAEENAWQQIRVFLQAINPYDFQNLVAELLRAVGYHVNWISPPGKDRGIDIIAYNDPLGTTMPRIKVQVKHRDTATTVEGLRAFMSILATDDVGIFVSSGGFTNDAREEARTQERRKITLLDLDQFYDLWVRHYDKLSREAHQQLPLRPVYYLDPED